MLNFLKSYFPDNKIVWKKYIFTSIPVILSAMVFALNAFVDNFMSTNIEGGNQALSYANTWTELEIGIISLTTIVGASIFSQYLGKKDFKSLKEIISFRIIFSTSIAILFAIPCVIAPKEMVLLISGFDEHIIQSALSNAIIYLRLITISWVLNAIWFTLSMILREKHHGIASFVSSLISLVLNIVLNSIFVFGCHFGIDFLAYSTIVANVISLSFVIIFIFLKDHELKINVLRMFFISSHILKQFFKRFSSFILLSIGSVLITIRFVVWNIGYPTGSIDNPEFYLSAANILGISGMFFNIFWTTLESVNANVNIYVGRELGNNNFDESIKNAKQLQGFHLIIATIMGLLLFALSFAIEQMTFLAEGYKLSLINNKQITDQTLLNNAVAAFMSNLKYTLWPLAFFMPLFIWFITRSRVISSGGHTNIVSIVECTFSAIQIGWLFLIALVFNSPSRPLSFPLAYFIFFLSDIPKLFVYEIIHWKVDWVRNITK